MRTIVTIATLAFAGFGWAVLPVARTELRPGDTLAARWDGREVELRLASVEERDAYSLYVLVGPDGPICGTRGGEPVAAVPLTGRWDARSEWHPRGLTLASTQGAIGKCVLWGYRLWSPRGATTTKPASAWFGPTTAATASATPATAPRPTFGTAEAFSAAPTFPTCASRPPGTWMALTEPRARASPLA